MTRTYSRILSLIAAVILAAAALGAAQEPESKPAPAATPPPAPEALIDLSFEGGTAAEYVQAVKKAAHRAGAPLNIVHPPELSQVKVPRIELQRVSVGAALRIFNGMSQLTTGGRMALEYVSSQTSPREAPVHQIRAYASGAGGGGKPLDAVAVSRIWNISGILQSGPTAADILTAIETALAMFGDEYPPPQIRVHEETNLLMARGAADQIDTIEQVFSRLSSSSDTERKEMTRQVAELMAERDAAKHAAEEKALEAERMRVHLEAMRLELGQNMQRLADAQKEAIHLRAQIEELTSQLQRARPGSSPHPPPGPR